MPDSTWRVPEGERLALRQLYEAGALCGHAASRAELGRRLEEASGLAEAQPELQALAGHQRAELDAARAHAQAIESALRARAAELESTRSALTQSQQAAEELRQRFDSLAREHDRQHRDWEAEVSAARARVRELEDSTFWRMTAPLRAVAHQLKRLRRALRLAPARVATAQQILRTAGPVELARRVQQKLAVPPAAAALGLQPRGAVAKAVGPLEVPMSAAPVVSVIIPAYGEALHTYSCLQSVAAEARTHALEAIVMDDRSPQPLRDEMPEVTGVRFERNEKNLGFLRNANRGASLARGEFLLFLNNDAQLEPGAIAALLAVFERHPDAGVAGAKLVFPDGRLQEAGGIVWSDGSAWNDGRGQHPGRPEFNFLRQADYVSGACLMIRRALFESLGGFDERYVPAYCEDADLCFRVRESGLGVWYQPAAEAVHHEGVSHGTDEASGIKRHQLVNRDRFRERWAAALSAHRANGVRVRLERTRAAKGRALLVEACIPTPDQDSGSVRCWRTMQILQDMGMQVTLVADNLEYQPVWTPRFQQEGIEVLRHPFTESIAAHLAECGADYDVVILTRHYVAAKHLEAVRRHAPRALVVFDTVDLHYLRAERLAALEGSTTLARSAAEVRQQELACIRAADVTWVVSPVERDELAREAPTARVIVHTNIHDPAMSARPWADREGILFVGGYRHPPNIDAATFYAREIVPHLCELLPGVTSYLAGSHAPESLLKLSGPGVEFLGFVPDIEAWLGRVRLSVSPLRYGAGVKGKVNQSMALGVPVVATSASVEGMHLVDGSEVIVADEPRAFAEAVAKVYQDEALWKRLSAGGIANIERHFSRAVARGALERTLACRASVGKVA